MHHGTERFFADCASSPQADKLQALIKAAKIEDVEPIWTSLFAKVRQTAIDFRSTGENDFETFF